ncbi:hypothetical protein LINPERHAP1_LOCUS2633 [Linum perenne]
MTIQDMEHLLERSGRKNKVNFVGSILIVVGTHYRSFLDAFIMELLAIRDVCWWCLYFNILQVDIKEYVELAFLRIFEEHVLASSDGVVVDEILPVARLIPFIRFCPVFRSGNRVAHSRLDLNFFQRICE